MNGIAKTRRAARRLALAAVASVVAMPGLAAGGTAATDTSVSIVFRAYQPSQLTVVAGQTVAWRNSGLGPHTVTADAGQFDSGTLQAGDYSTPTCASAPRRCRARGRRTAAT